MLSKFTPDSSQMQLSLQPERRIFTVSALNSVLQEILDAEFAGLFVAGEISGCRMAASGHYYFTLKDPSSQLSCALFKGTARYLKFKPQDGLAVIARGNLQIYQPRGEYSLIVESLEPQGAGALQVAFEQLKRKLASEGLFEPSRKRPLPRLPWRIGIVTSPTGAVIRDMLHIFQRRFPGLHLRLFPAQVQGENACEQIVAGLTYFNSQTWANLVIVARGGGSLEDLWTFNEEAVARAVAASNVPVISAVGHETDFTICDFVADYRAPTPSAAAEIAICTRESLLDQIAVGRGKLVQAARYRLSRSHTDLHRQAVDRAGSLVHRAITRRLQRLDDLDTTLRTAQRRAMERSTKQLRDLEARLRAADIRLRLAAHRRLQQRQQDNLVASIQKRVWQSRRRWEALHLHLAQLSPLTILSRGYAIVLNEQGHALRSSSEIAGGAPIEVRLHEGRLSARVEETSK